MPIVISKYDVGSTPPVLQTTYTINNFASCFIDGNTGANIIGNITGDRQDTLLMNLLGMTSTINIDWTLATETSTVVTGAGGTVTSPPDQLRYLFTHLIPLDATADSGKATAGAAATLTDSAKSWTTNQWTNYILNIVGGTGSGQIRTISSNTGTVLTVSPNWGTNPDTTSVYKIINASQISAEYFLYLDFGGVSDSGTASSGTVAALTDSAKSWTVDQYRLRVLKITGGTGSGQLRNITGNNATNLIVDYVFDTAPDATSTYQIIDGFGSRGMISKLNCNTSENTPLTFSSHIEFLVGDVV